MLLLASAAASTYKRARAATLCGTLYVGWRRVRVAICACCCSCCFLGAEIGEPFLQLLRSLRPDLLRRPFLAGRRISCGLETLILGCPVVLVDSLFVLLPDLLRYTLHAEDLNIQSLTIGEGIFDVGKSLFMDLVHVDRET